MAKPRIRLPVIFTTDIAVFRSPYIHFRRRYHEYIFYYILEGELFLTEGEVNYHLKENDFVILEPSMEHSGWKASECSFCYVHFSWEQLETERQTLLERVESEAGENAKGSLLLQKYYHVKGIRNVLRSRHHFRARQRK